MNLKTKTKKLIACCWIFLNANTTVQNADSLRISNMMMKSNTSIDSAKYYAQKMQELLRNMKFKQEQEKKQNPH